MLAGAIDREIRAGSGARGGVAVLGGSRRDASGTGTAQTLPMLARLQIVFLEEAEAIESSWRKTARAVRNSKRIGNPAPFTVFVAEATGWISA